MTTYNTFVKAQLHFGDSTWYVHIGNDDVDNEVYAVYNDDEENTLQLGIITEVDGVTFIATDFDEAEKQPSILYCDTLDVFSIWHEELDENPDFDYIGAFDTIESIYEYFNYQGFKNYQTIQLSKNRYGNILEIARIDDEFIVYIGAR